MFDYFLYIKSEKRRVLKLYNENPEKAFLKVYKSFKAMTISICRKYSITNLMLTIFYKILFVGLLEIMRKQDLL